MTMARAIATRCCWPPESWPGSLSPWSREPHDRERLVDLALDLRLRPCPASQAEADVLAHGHMRKQRVVLEHHAEAALFRPQLSIRRLVEPDAAAGQRQQPGEAVERRRLAAAGRAEQGDELAPLDRQGDVLQRVDVPKSRLMPSSRSSRKSRAAMAIDLVPCRQPTAADSEDAATAIASLLSSAVAHFFFCAADLLVPAC